MNPAILRLMRQVAVKRSVCLPTLLHEWDRPQSTWNISEETEHPWFHMWAKSSGQNFFNWFKIFQNGCFEGGIRHYKRFIKILFQRLFYLHHSLQTFSMVWDPNVAVWHSINSDHGFGGHSLDPFRQVVPSICPRKSSRWIFCASVPGSHMEPYRALSGQWPCLLYNQNSLFPILPSKSLRCPYKPTGSLQPYKAV